MNVQLKFSVSVAEDSHRHFVIGICSMHHLHEILESRYSDPLAIVGMARGTRRAKHLANLEGMKGTHPVRMDLNSFLPKLLTHMVQNSLIIT